MTTTTKHTPGPWGLMEHRDGHFALTPPDGRCACFGMLPNEDDEDRANARLIAAAPELLAVLKEALAVHGGDIRFGPDEDEHSWCASARAAIAKATADA